MKIWIVIVTDTMKGKRGARSRRYAIQAESAAAAKEKLISERPDVVAYAKAWLAREWDYQTYLMDQCHLTTEAATRMHERDGEGFTMPLPNQHNDLETP